MFIKWSHILRLLPWLIKFMSNATDTKTQRIVANLDPPLYNKVAEHKALIDNASLTKWITDSKFNYAYPAYSGQNDQSFWS